MNNTLYISIAFSHILVKLGLQTSVYYKLHLELRFRFFKVLDYDKFSRGGAKTF